MSEPTDDLGTVLARLEEALPDRDLPWRRDPLDRQRVTDRNWNGVANVFMEGDATWMVAVSHALPDLLRLAREREELRTAVLADHDGISCCDRTFESLRGVGPCPTARLVADITGATS